MSDKLLYPEILTEVKYQVTFRQKRIAHIENIITCSADLIVLKLVAKV